MSSKITLHDHSNLDGKHALFAPSQSSWLRYDPEKIAERVRNQYRTTLGTEIHEFAAAEIELGNKYKSTRELIKSLQTYMYSKYKYLSDNLTVSSYAKKLISNLKLLPKEVYEAVRFYINDGVGYKMDIEQCVFYSDHIFGHADTLLYKDNLLRIHDLKTGAHIADIDQLKVYAALFCLEYELKPSNMQFELRLYQWDGVTIINPEPDEIREITDIIVSVENIAARTEKEV